MIKKKGKTVNDEKVVKKTSDEIQSTKIKYNKSKSYFTYSNRIMARVIFSALSFILMIVFIFMSLKVNVITKLGYTQNSNLDYTVNLKENNYYQQKKLGKNMTYIASLIDSIDVVFDYNFNTTKPINYKYSYYVEGEVKVTSDDGKNVIFSKKNNIVNEQSFNKDNSDNFSLKKNVNIDYDKYNNMIKSFKSQYGITASSELVVTMYVKVTDVNGNELNKVNANNSMNITIPLTQQMVNIKMNYNNVNNSDTFNSKAKLIIGNKVLFYIGLVFGAFGLVSIVSLLLFLRKSSKKKTIYEKELAKILREFDRIIVESKNDIYIDQKQDLIEVKSFSELLDVRDNLEKPILFKEIHKGQKSEFYVKNDYEVYKFTLKAVDLENSKKKGKM